MECFFEEETLTLTSGLCYQWLHVVLLAFVVGEQGNGLVLSLRGCVQQIRKNQPNSFHRVGPPFKVWWVRLGYEYFFKSG